MWAYETTFYQIYPLGFCGAPRENAAPVAEDELAQAADATASPDAPIMKIAKWADYLQELGVGTVLINPPLESDSHGYDTRSLRHIDRRLGGDVDFAAVCDTLHAHGIRVVLDAVFNHVGRGFWAFRDVQERKWDSPYKDWFHISFDGDSCYGDGFWYEGWEGHFELVKLNLQNPAVVNYLLESVRRWAEVFGVDGLRLDVAYMLDRDFMRRLHAFTRELKPDFVLIGETLHGDYNQIVNDEMLDSCTNYECYKGNHDVPRLASILTDKSCLRPAYGMLFGMPGIPCVYYGSEWGIAGEKGGPDGDWALRPALDEPAPNELTAFITQLAHLRSANDAAARALNYGAYRNVVIQNKQLLFERACDDVTVLVAVNAVDEPYTFGAGELNGSFVDLLADGVPTVELAGSLELAPYEVRYLLRA